MNSAAHNAASPFEKDLTLSDLLSMLVRRRWIFVCAAVVGLCGSFAYHVWKPSYVASATLAIQKSDDSPVMSLYSALGSISGLKGSRTADLLRRYPAVLETNQFYIELAERILANPNARRIVEIYGANVANGDKSPRAMEIFARRLHGVLRYEVDEYGGIVFHASSKDPLLAAELVNETVDDAVAAFEELDIRDLEAAQTYIRDQLQEIVVDLKSYEEQIEKIRSQYDLQPINSATGMSLESAQGEKLRAELRENQLKLESNMRQMNAIVARVKREDRELIKAGGSQSSLVVKLRRQLKALQDRKDQLVVQGYTSDSPEISFIQEEIAKRAKLFEGLKKDAGGAAVATDDSMLNPQRSLLALRAANLTLTRRSEILQSLIDDLAKKAKDQFSGQQALAELRHSMDLKAQFLRELEKRRFELGMQKIAVENRFRVLDRATSMTVRESTSLNKKLGVGTAIALLLAFCLVLMLETFFPRINKSLDLNTLGLRGLGYIPRVRGLDSPSGPDPESLSESSPVTLGFRYISSRAVRITTPEGEISKVMAVLGTEVGAGASFIAANLALSHSAVGRRTLLIDADVRCGTLHKSFGVDASRGSLTSILCGKTDLASALHKNVTPNLDFIAAGDFDPLLIERFITERFTSLVNELRDHYDTIVIDTPPFDYTVDAMAVVESSDVVALIARCELTPCSLVAETIEKISHVGDRLYYILNWAPERRNRGRGNVKNSNQPPSSSGRKVA